MLRKEREAHGDLTSSNIWVLETGLVKTGPPAILKLNVGGEDKPVFLYHDSYDINILDGKISVMGLGESSKADYEAISSLSMELISHGQNIFFPTRTSKKVHIKV